MKHVFLVLIYSTLVVTDLFLDSYQTLAVDAEIDVDIAIKWSNSSAVVTVNKVYTKVNGSVRKEETNKKTKISAFKKYTKKFILGLIAVQKLAKGSTPDQIIAAVKLKTAE